MLCPPFKTWLRLRRYMTGSLGFISFHTRLQIRWEVDFEIITVETTCTSVMCNRGLFTYKQAVISSFFQSLNSCYCKLLRILKFCDSCLALCHVNEMYRRRHHDFGPDEVQGELTHLSCWALSRVYNRKCVCPSVSCLFLSVSGRNLINA